jgi:hypothetical protein
MAKDNGISASELSKTVNLVRVVFPYLANELGMNVALVWEQVGKSKFSDMLPYLRAMITGEPSERESVNETVENLLDDTAATASAAGQDIDDTEILRRTVGNLIQDGTLLTNRQVRERLRPERTPPLRISVIHNNGHRVVVANISEEQWDLLERQMGSRMEPMVIELPLDPRQRQIEAARIPEIRTLINLLEVST